MNINIRDIDPEVVELIDKCVKAEGYNSRTQFVEEVIRLYVLTRDKFFTKALPPTVKFITEEYIGKQQQSIEKLQELNHNTNVKILEELKKISEELGVLS